MPLAPAAKGILLLTPVVLAAGYAIYDSHEPFRNFIDEQWRKWEAFVDERGWITSHHDYRRQEMPFATRPWNSTDQSSSEHGGTAYVAHRRNQTAQLAEDSGTGAAASTASDAANISDSNKKLRQRAKVISDEQIMGETAMMPNAGEAAQRSTGAARLSSRSLSGVGTKIAKQEIASGFDNSSERSWGSSDMILTPTTEEGSWFGDESTEQEYGDAARGADGVDMSSDTTEAAIDTDIDMVGSMNSSIISVSESAASDLDNTSVSRNSWNDADSRS